MLIGTKPSKLSTLVPGEDLVLDSALESHAGDRFDHEAIATVVTDLAVSGTSPLNIALWGPWGSGKTSFLGLVREKIENSGSAVQVARYDAWKYGGRALKKHFVKSIAAELKIEDEKFNAQLDHDHEQSKLDLRRWVTDNWRSLGFGFLLAIAVTAGWFVTVGIVHLLTHLHDKGHFWPKVGQAADFATNGVGAVLGLAFAALVVGPKMLESAVVKVVEPAPETDDEFATRFQDLVAKALKEKSADRLVVFIDELDRCSPEDVVATLVDLKTFLDIDQCVFIVAADREVLERALEQVPQATPVRDDEPYYSTAGAFLDKVFQHRIPLPPLRTQALTKFARELVQSQGGLWAQLREAEPDDRLFLRVIYALIPAHVRSPRRAKVLLNNYATNVRIAEARGTDWLGRADELACLTVLETEFPRVAADLMRIPLLLSYLRDDTQTPTSAEVGRVVNGYRHRDPAATNDLVPQDGQPAGPLLPSGEPKATDVQARQRANKVLNAQLHSYLRKVAAQEVQDPRPDLFYLQSAGSAVGISDPELGYVLDLAGDMSASEVVDAFAPHPSATAAAGVRVLVQQAENDRGPSRTTLLEAACRIVERLDPSDLQEVAQYAAGGVLAEVGLPDWPAEATPGAVLLGVMGESHELVESLLRSTTPEQLAESGTLQRFVPVLGIARPAQVDLVHQLLTSVYLMHPVPLHSALREAPLDSAISLYDAASDDIDDALIELSRAHAAAVSTGQPTDFEKAGTRWRNLLSAATDRTDEAGPLISRILELGQRSSDESVKEARVDLEDDALERITDGERLNLHALLGLERAALDHADFWADYLTESPYDHEQAARSFERLVAAIPGQSVELVTKMEAAAEKVVPYLDDSYEGGPELLKAALSAAPWPSDTQRDERPALYAVAHGLSAKVADAQPVEQVLVDDLINGIQTAPTLAAAQALAVSLVGRFGPASAQVLEEALKNRSTAEPEIVMVLRIRVAAAAATGSNAPDAAELLVAKDAEGDRKLLSEWLMLGPPLSEVLKVLGNIKVDRQAIDEYARKLSAADRTRCWIDLESRGWPTEGLQAVGQHGVGASAVAHIASKILAPTQQKERDELASRLATAAMKDTQAKKAVAELLRNLLTSQVQGNIGTAAQVAIGCGGVPYNSRVETRNAFEAAIVGKSNVLTLAEMNQLRALGLLSKPKKKGWFGL